jgi:hypothetical protein
MFGPIITLINRFRLRYAHFVTQMSILKSWSILASHDHQDRTFSHPEGPRSSLWTFWKLSRTLASPP